MRIFWPLYMASLIISTNAYCFEGEHEAEELLRITEQTRTSGKSRCEKLESEFKAIASEQNNITTNGENKQTLKKLKKEYDETTAKLVLLSGVMKVKDDYEKIKKDVENSFEKIISETLTKTEQNLEMAQQAIDRIKSLELLVNHFMSDLTKHQQNSTKNSEILTPKKLRRQLKSNNLTLYQYFKSECRKFKDAKFCTYLNSNQDGIDSGLINGFGEAYIHLGDSPTEDTLNELAATLRKGYYDIRGNDGPSSFKNYNVDMGSNNYLLITEGEEYLKTKEKLKKQRLLAHAVRKAAESNSNQLTGTSSIDGKNGSINFNSDLDAGYIEGLKEGLRGTNRGFIKAYDKCFENLGKCDLKEGGDLKKSITAFFESAKAVSTDQQSLAVAKDKMIPESELNSLYQKTIAEIDRLKERNRTPDEKSILDSLGGLKEIGSFKAAKNFNLNDFVDDKNKLITDVLCNGELVDSDCITKKLFINNSGDLEIDPLVLQTFFAQMNIKDVNEKISSLREKQQNLRDQISSITGGDGKMAIAGFRAYETLKQVVLNEIQKNCHNKIKVQTIDCGRVDGLESLDPLMKLTTSTGEVISVMSHIDRSISSNWQDANDLCEAPLGPTLIGRAKKAKREKEIDTKEKREITYKDPEKLKLQDVLKTTCKAVAKHREVEKHGTKEDRVRRKFADNHYVRDAQGNTHLVPKTSTAAMVGTTFMGSLMTHGFPMFIQNQYMNDYYLPSAVYDAQQQVQWSNLLTTGQMAPTAWGGTVLDPYGIYGYNPSPMPLTPQNALHLSPDIYFDNVGTINTASYSTGYNFN